MVDLEVYRRRIGSYRPSARYKKKTKQIFVRRNWSTDLPPYLKKDDRREENQPFNLNWKISIMFLCIGAFVTWFPTDDRYGKNRQRPGNNRCEFHFHSDGEKKLFNAIRSTEADLIRAESHCFFFTECQRRKVHPTNLEFNNNFNIAFSDQQMNAKLKEIDGKNIMEKILLCVNHFKLQVSRLREEVSIKKDQLEKSSSESRFSYLMERLERFNRKLKTELKKKKEKKLAKLHWTGENISNMEDDNSEWLPHLYLKKADRETILSHRELEDQHINAALGMLAQEYPIIVQPTTLMRTDAGFQYCPSETLQIIHTGAHHWILLSSLNQQVQIYDSLNTKVTKQL